MMSLAERQMPAAVAPVLRLSDAREVPGYAYGLRAPGAVARIGLEDPSYWQAVARCAQERLASELPLDLSKAPEHSSRDDGAGVLSSMARLIQALQEASGLPATGAARVLALPSAGPAASRVDKQWLLAVPSLVPRVALEALRWTVDYMNDLASKPDDAASSDARKADLQRLLGRLRRYAPGGTNNRCFIGAAYQLNIPCMPLPGGVFQYGWGRRAQWLDSSFTETTSNISTRLARSKMITNALLRQAGLPVPAQVPVGTLDEAIAAATKLGYPVVLKPANLDGGVGVSAGLESQDEVRKAFERARKHSSALLMEKQIEGRDYRVYVFRGRAFSAMERVPAAVTGDGVSTVRALVDQVNLDPRRGEQFWMPMSRIEIDEEALELLAAEGLTPDCVPAAGRFVQLRRAANISSGGTPRRVFDEMHPDNARLCERAAQILRLDLAGIDLLMPDITRSWREVGAGICEVNAQPQLSGATAPESYAQVLGELVPKQGRIPSAIVLTGHAEATLAEEVANLLAQRNLCVGTSSAAGLRIGAQCIRAGRGNAFRDTRMLLIDPSVDALVIATDGREFLANGLPLDRFDVLAIAGWTAEGKGRAGAATRLRSMLALLEAHCAGEVLVARDDPAAAVAAGIFKGKRLRMTNSAHELSARLAAALLAL